LAVYQHLLFNNLLGLLSNGFPVCVRLLGEPAWSALVRHYFATHRCQTPLFTELAAEFVQWLQAQPQLPHPALAELAHYEWVETALYQLQPSHCLRLAMSIRCGCRCSARRWRGRCCTSGRCTVSVPRMRRRSPASEPTGLLVRREADGEVRFAALSPLAVYLLSSIGEPWPRRPYVPATPRHHAWAGRGRWPDPVPRCCSSSCRPA
jgi:hypothetical protein